MKRRNFLASLAALVAVPKALQAAKPKPDAVQGVGWIRTLGTDGEWHNIGEVQSFSMQFDAGVMSPAKVLSMEDWP